MRKKEENILYLKERNWWLHVLIWITVCWPESYTNLKVVLDNVLFIMGAIFAQLKFGDSVNKGKMEELILKISYSLNTLQEVS